MKRFIKGVGVLKIIQHLQRDHSKLHAPLPPSPHKREYGHSRKTPQSPLSNLFFNLNLFLCKNSFHIMKFKLEVVTSSDGRKQKMNWNFTFPVLRICCYFYIFQDSSFKEINLVDGIAVVRYCEYISRDICSNYGNQHYTAFVERLLSSLFSAWCLLNCQL